MAGFLKSLFGGRKPPPPDPDELDFPEDGLIEARAPAPPTPAPPTPAPPTPAPPPGPNAAPPIQSAASPAPSAPVELDPVADLFAAAKAGDAEMTAWLGAALRAERPDEAAGYVLPARALRDGGRIDEAEALLAEARHLPPDLLTMITSVELAFARRDWDAALARARALAEAFPDHPTGLVLTAAALREMGRGAEAEVAAGLARERWPQDLSVLLGWAETAARRRDWQYAALRGAEVRRAFPDHEAGYRIEAQALREDGRGPEAEAVMAVAVGRLPHDAGLLAGWARRAAASGDWPAAAERSALLRARFPGLPEGYTIGIQALRGRGDLEGAKALVAQAMTVSERDPSLYVAWAEVALDGADWAEAEDATARLRENHPDHWIGWFLGARALMAQGRDDAADALLAAGRPRLAPVPAIETIWADAAARRGDWPAAIARAEHARALFPDVTNGTMQGVTALIQAGRLEEAAALADEGVRRFPDDAMVARLPVEVARAMPAPASVPAAPPLQGGGFEDALRLWDAMAADGSARSEAALDAALRITLANPWHEGVQPLFEALGAEQPAGGPGWRAMVEKAPGVAGSPEQFHVWREASAAFLHDADGLDPETRARWLALVG